MAKVTCNIKTDKENIYIGDLVSYKGNIGLMCEYYDAINVTEIYFIQGFDGKVLSYYGEFYSDVDQDPNAILLCKRDELVINISKKGE